MNEFIEGHAQDTDGDKERAEDQGGDAELGLTNAIVLFHQLYVYDRRMSTANTRPIMGRLTYVCIYLDGKVCAEQRCEEESNAESDIRQTTCADTEAIDAREDLCKQVRVQIHGLTSAETTYRGRWRT